MLDSENQRRREFWGACLFNTFLYLILVTGGCALGIFVLYLFAYFII